MWPFGEMNIFTDGSKIPLLDFETTAASDTDKPDKPYLSRNAKSKYHLKSNYIFNRVSIFTTASSIVFLLYLPNN